MLAPAWPVEATCKIKMVDKSTHRQLRMMDMYWEINIIYTAIKFHECWVKKG